MFLSYVAKGFYNKSSGAPRETGMLIRGVSTLSKAQDVPSMEIKTISRQRFTRFYPRLA